MRVALFREKRVSSSLDAVVLPQAPPYLRRPTRPGIQALIM